MKTTMTDMPNIQLIPVGAEEIKKLLYIAFVDDEDLLKKYTPVPNDTMENCINRCYENIKEMLTGAVYESSKKEIYKVSIVSEGSENTIYTTIGFSIIIINEDIPNELFSFGINIHYRSKKIVLKWLREVQWKLGKYFWVALYAQNTRAINFFIKNGLTLHEEEGRHFVTLHANHEEYTNLVKNK